MTAGYYRIGAFAQANLSLYSVYPLIQNLKKKLMKKTIINSKLTVQSEIKQKLIKGG